MIDVEDNLSALQVVKRNGKKVEWTGTKIAVAIKKGFDSIKDENEENKYTEKDINKIFNSPLIDIHGGGFDLKFPHHENERAQSKAVYNSNLANYWMHVGFMNFEDTKMSKSLGNVIAMRDLLKELNPDVFRLFILKANYRAPLSFSQEAIDTTKREVEKYRSVKKSLNLYLATNKDRKSVV